jgi:hypothetical protein
VRAAERERYLEAARVPDSLQPQEFGRWVIRRRPAPSDEFMRENGLDPIGFPTLTMFETRREPIPDPADPYAAEFGGCGHASTECVMEDSRTELLQHMPIWLAARGRVLVTGLGLGCVVRGLLASPRVELVDVVEIDADVLRVVGPEFAANPRVRLHHADALTFDPPGERWDFAWHDIWTEGPSHLQHLHVQLIGRNRGRCGRQGAWKLPRFAKRLLGPTVIP